MPTSNRRLLLIFWKSCPTQKSGAMLLGLCALLIVAFDACAECKGQGLERFGAGCETPQSLREQDDLLNRYYQSLIQGLSRSERNDWRRSQSAWLKSRDAKCGLDHEASTREEWFGQIEGDPEKLTCVMRVTQERLTELESKYGNRGVLNAWKVEPAPQPDWEQEGDGESRQKISSPAVSKGKFYFEVSLSGAAIVPGRELSVLIGILGLPLGPLADAADAAQGGQNYFTFLTSGGPLSVDAAGYQVIGIAADLDAGQMYVRNNGTWAGGAPGTAVGSALKPGWQYRAQVSANIMLAPMIEHGLLKVNFGSDPFRYQLPGGYLPFEPAAQER